MLLRLIMGLTLTLGFSVAATAQSIDWSTADGLYAQRENNQPVIEQARSAYKAILATPNISQDDKIRAVSQLGRLAIYQGQMLLPKGDDGRYKIFADCWCADPVVYIPYVSGKCETAGFTDLIKPAAPTDPGAAAYYYFTTVCSAFWGEVASSSEQVVFSPLLKNTFAEEVSSDQSVEGGGQNRVKSAVYSNPAARAVHLYDINQAAQCIDAALATADGGLYYDNYQYKVKVLMQLDAENPNGPYKSQAVDVNTSALDEMDGRIAAGNYPPGREPEFKFIYEQLKITYKTLTGGDWGKTH